MAPMAPVKLLQTLGVGLLIAAFLVGITTDNTALTVSLGMLGISCGALVGLITGDNPGR